MNTKRKIAMAAAACVVISSGLAAVAWFTWNGGKEGAQANTGDENSVNADKRLAKGVDNHLFPETPPPAESHDRAPGCAFETGQELTYAINTTAEGSIRPEQAGQPQGNAPVELSQDTMAVADFKVLSVDEAAAVLVGRYRKIDSNQLTKLSELQEPFLIKVNDRCKLDSFAYLRTTPKAYGRIQQALVSELSWSWPEQSPGELQAQNGMGPYYASTTVREGQDGLMVERIVRSYDTFWDDDFGRSRGLEIVPESSSARVRVGQGPWFESIRSTESLNGENSFLRNYVRVTKMDTPEGVFVNIPTNTERYVWANLLARDYRVPEDRAYTRRDFEAQKRVRNWTPKKAVDRFMARVKAGKGIAEQWPELTLYLEARPDATATVVQMFASGEVPDEAAQSFYVALGRARTKESRDILKGIAFGAGGAPPMEMTRAMFALVDRDDVGPSYAESLMELVPYTVSGDGRAEKFIGRESLLALTMMASLRSDEEVTKLAKSGISQVLATARTPDDLWAAYAGMGNLGDPDMLALAGPATRDKNPEVRALAAMVVRRMHPQDSDAFVAEWLGRETDWDVKREIYTHLRRQTHDIRVPVSEAIVQHAVRDLGQDPGPITRKAILHVLGRAAKASEAARLALMARVGIEATSKNNLYGVIAKYLEPADLRAALRAGGVIRER